MTVPCDGVKTGAGMLVIIAVGAAVVLTALVVCTGAGALVVGTIVVGTTVATVVAAGCTGDEDAHPAKSAESTRSPHMILITVICGVIDWCFMMDHSIEYIVCGK